jgi:hypothetical protein
LILESLNKYYNRKPDNYCGIRWLKSPKVGKEFSEKEILQEQNHRTQKWIFTIGFSKNGYKS